jgi:predicted RNA binding protein YcfA (HicA-like mRNA interferase family)
MSVPWNQRQWRMRLEAAGWTLERGGKHAVKMTKPGRRPITLPYHGGQTYGKGLDAAIRRQMKGGR